MRSRIRVVLMGLLLLPAAAVGLRSALRAVSRRYLFPVGEVTAPLQSDLRDVERLSLRADDAVPVHALFLAPPEGAAVIVSFHNNRSTAEDQLPIARSLRARGFGVALVEYRGYGTAAGYEPTEEGLFADAEAVLAALSRRGVGPERIVVWGTSLGSGVAAEMASRGRASALVLVAPYTSIPDLVSDVVPFAPSRQIVADAFDTLARSRTIRVPTLVIHGDNDEIVPFWMGQRIASSIAGARLLRIPGGHHGDLFARAGDRLLGEMAAVVRTTGRNTH